MSHFNEHAKSAVKENTTIMDAYTQLTVRSRRDIPNNKMEDARKHPPFYCCLFLHLIRRFQHFLYRHFQLGIDTLQGMFRLVVYLDVGV